MLVTVLGILTVVKFEQLLKQEPDSPVLNFGFIKAAIQKGDFSQAIEGYEALINNNSIDSSILEKASFSLANLYIKIEQYRND